uniref:Uncharacterized protein n=1 Tax=Glossina pallidipes TaxID=7398 RepID=A0A1A9ZYB2_GLOPL
MDQASDYSKLISFNAYSLDISLSPPLIFREGDVECDPLCFDRHSRAKWPASGSAKSSNWLTSFTCLAPYFLSNASMTAANSVLFPSGIIWIISAADTLKEVIKATALSSSSHIFFVATTPNCSLNALKLFQLDDW